MRWKWLGITAGAGVAAMLLCCGGCYGGGMLIDPHVEVGTTKNLEATPESVWPFLSTASGIAKWWAIPGAGMEVKAQPGPSEGVGTVVTFEAGGGVMETWEIEEIEVGRQVVYEVDFAGMMVVERTITLEPEGTGTKATWHETGEIASPVFRWMTVLMPEEDVVANFDAALGALDEAAR